MATVPELMAAVAAEIDNLIEVDLLQEVGPDAHESMRESGELEAWRVRFWQSLLDGVTESQRSKGWRDYLTIH